MDNYTTGLNKIESLLRSNGWKIIKDPKNGAKDFRAQGVIYINFRKGEKVIHLEYGDEECVFS